MLSGTLVLIGGKKNGNGDERLLAYEECLERVRYVCRYLLLLQVGDYLQGVGEESLSGLLGRCFGEDTAALEIGALGGTYRYAANPLLVRGFDDSKRPTWVKGYKLRSVGGLKFTRQRAKRIALISHVMARNGAPLALMSAAKILKEAGYELDVYTVVSGALVNDFKALGIPVVIDPIVHGMPFPDQPWYHDYDLIIANTAVLIGCFRKQLTDTPVLWWLHESASILEWSGVNAECFSKVKMEGVKALAVSEVTIRDIHALAPELPINSTLTLGIKDEFKGREKKEDKSPFVFMMCGSWEERKGQDIFLKAIGMLSEEERRKCEFLLVGGKGTVTTPDYSKEVESLSAALPEVKLVERIPHEEVLALYEKVDAVVVPSREESLSMVAIEALMMGRPCIVSDNVGVAADVREGGAGLIFSSGEVDELADKMRILMSDTNLAENMGKSGRMAYKSKFTSEKFAEKILMEVEAFLKDE